MPAKTTTDYSITIRIGVPIVPILKMEALAEYFDTISDRYGIGYEQKEGPASGHYQCGVVLRSPRRSDHFKRTLKEDLKKIMFPFVWSPDNEKKLLESKAHHDLTTLVGGYCTKQSINPIIKGYSEDELKGGKDRYAVLLSERLKELPVSKSALMPLLKEFYDRVISHTSISPEFDLAFALKSGSDKFHLMESLIMAEGYDLSEALAGSRRIYIVRHFEDIFAPKTSEQLFEHFYKTAR